VAGNAVQSSEGPRRYRDRSTSTTVDGTTSRVELKQVMGLNSFKMISPTVGSSVPLLFDARSGKVKFDVDDPRIALDSSDFLREDHKEDRDAYKSALKGALLATSDHEGDQLDPRVRRARVALREARRRGDAAEVERLTTELQELERGRGQESAQPHSSAGAESLEQPRQPHGSPGVESPEQRLATLQRLRDDGVITAEEYTAQRQRILASL